MQQHVAVCGLLVWQKGLQGGLLFREYGVVPGLSKLDI